MDFVRKMFLNVKTEKVNAFRKTQGLILNVYYARPPGFGRTCEQGKGGR